MKKQNFTLTVTTKTGLHIGSGNDKLQIGGVDSAVIKDPNSKLPYIPGSSLKGKIRCLLETESDRFSAKGEMDETLNRIFGINNTFRKSKGKEIEKYEEPTRIIFRDLFLTEEEKKDFENNKIITEFKTEIVINRKKGTAADGGLRTIERIPPDIEFKGDIIIRYKNDAELEEIKKVLDEGIKLLNNDYLGGSGSRGYGAVIVNLT
jgi:CRISPR-associated protein Csm3